MINNRKFTDKEIKQICSNIVLIYDTREKVNNNILDWCSHKDRVEVSKEKLDYGDYTFKVKAIPELGINYDLDFRNEIVIERKNSLEEISTNLTKGRTRFCEELAMCNAKMVIVIEDEWDNLFMGKYNTQYNRRSFIATLQSFEHRYGVTFKMMSKEAIPVFIYSYFYYWLREKLIQ